MATDSRHDYRCGRRRGLAPPLSRMASSPPPPFRTAWPRCAGTSSVSCIALLVVDEPGSMRSCCFLRPWGQQSQTSHHRDRGAEAPRPYVHQHITPRRAAERFRGSRTRPRPKWLSPFLSAGTCRRGGGSVPPSFSRTLCPRRSANALPLARHVMVSRRRVGRVEDQVEENRAQDGRMPPH